MTIYGIKSWESHAHTRKSRIQNSESPIFIEMSPKTRRGGEGGAPPGAGRGGRDTHRAGRWGPVGRELVPVKASSGAGTGSQ